MTIMTATRAAQLVAAYDASGIHRASTPGDYASGDWIAGEASVLGAQVGRATVRLDRTVVDEAFLECCGQRVDALPMFDSPAGPDDGVSGTLVACGEQGEIGFIELAPAAAGNKGGEFESLRRASRHAAIVVATRVAGESLAPINAQHFAVPFGPPVLQVAGGHGDWLAQAAAGARAARVVSRHHREPADSFNVCAQVVAPTGDPPIVVVTPRTGWWESTAERAGGIVAWLAVLQAAAAAGTNLARSVRAFASCGHELGHVGLGALLACEPELVRAARRCLHLGANLGCASSATIVVRASEHADAEAIRSLLIEEGYPADALQLQPIATASGEGRDLVRHGGQVLSLIGTNAHFHAASDRWPGNVYAGNVAAVARACARWVMLHAGA